MSVPLPLSGVVITKNEADRIGRCVASMRALCAEVIVLDSGSTDATVEVARSLGARVEQRDWQGFAAQKNAATAMAGQPWVLLLDASAQAAGDLGGGIGRARIEHDHLGAQRPHRSDATADAVAFVLRDHHAGDRQRRRLSHQRSFLRATSAPRLRYSARASASAR